MNTLELKRTLVTRYPVGALRSKAKIQLGRQALASLPGNHYTLTIDPALQGEQGWQHGELRQRHSSLR